jgi:hypothetical protein
VAELVGRDRAVREDVDVRRDADVRLLDGAGVGRLEEVVAGGCRTEEQQSRNRRER